MPPSLRFVLILLALGVAGAFASGFFQFRHTDTETRNAAETMTGGNAEAGKAAIVRFGCGSCHVIPGIAIARGRVGPSLRGVARRSLLAGKLANGPGTMALWVRFPQHVSPDAGMPEQPMSEKDARNIAAYLFTLRR